VNLYEFQGKQLFQKFGIPVPHSFVITKPHEAKQACEKLGGKAVLKVQVHKGGRGKAGGVKKANSPQEAMEIAGSMILNPILGERVNYVLVEEMVPIQQELYLSIVLDRSLGRNVAILSTKGGMDIEEVARIAPQAISHMPADPVIGLQDFHIRNLMAGAELPKTLWKPVSQFVTLLYSAYLALDATLLEINPLVVLEDGSLRAADAKVTLDDNALFRHTELREIEEVAVGDPLEAEGAMKKIAFIRLEGNVGIIGNGAGLVMCTMDEVKRAGGGPANFLDVGGGAKADVSQQCLELVLKQPNIQSVFINIFGGITRCDEAARGFVEAAKNSAKKVPLVVRLTGTREEEGKKIIAGEGWTTVDTMTEGAERAVQLAKGAP